MKSTLARAAMLMTLLGNREGLQPGSSFVKAVNIGDKPYQKLDSHGVYHDFAASERDTQPKDVGHDLPSIEADPVVAAMESAAEPVPKKRAMPQKLQSLSAADARSRQMSVGEFEVPEDLPDAVYPSQHATEHQSLYEDHESDYDLVQEHEDHDDDHLEEHEEENVFVDQLQDNFEDSTWADESFMQFADDDSYNMQDEDDFAEEDHEALEQLE